jgi:hypothetical protein
MSVGEPTITMQTLFHRTRICQCWVYSIGKEQCFSSSFGEQAAINHTLRLILISFIRNFLFWFTICFYAFLRHLFIYVIPLSSVSLVTVNQLAPLGTFIVFFLVFVNGSLYNRYVRQYELAQMIPGHINRILYIIRPFFQPEATWRFYRYLNAAHCAGYVGLSGGTIYSKSNFFDVIVKKHQLLTESEFERITEIDPSLSQRGAIYRELLAWCSDEIGFFFLNLTNSKVPNQLCTAVLAEINNFESRVAGLYEFSDQPIPFIFIHLGEWSLVH